MPIEIRELIIKAVVEPESKGRTEGSSPKERKTEKRIIAESVDQTLKILKKKQER